MNALGSSIENGRIKGEMALYFGCLNRIGHFLYEPSGRSLYSSNRPVDFPWREELMDGGLLKNGNVPDVTTGKVYWTCGGKDSFWYAFYWWDRSFDTRGASNSGFYVRGFGYPEIKNAFEYACSQFPQVIERQKFPLILQVK